jgi:hypothetical protein
MRSHYTTYIKPPLNPSKKEKSRSEMRIENQAIDQTNRERRGNGPIYSRVTGRRSSKTTARYWSVFPKLRLTSTKSIRHPAGTVDITATIC